jgi:hypothetical protein
MEPGEVQKVDFITRSFDSSPLYARREQCVNSLAGHFLLIKIIRMHQTKL